MRNAQDVRDFAAKQNSDSYLAATAPTADAEEGMEEMAERYRDGGDLYLPANE